MKRWNDHVCTCNDIFVYQTRLVFQICRTRILKLLFWNFKIPCFGFFFLLICDNKLRITVLKLKVSVLFWERDGTVSLSILFMYTFTLLFELYPCTNNLRLVGFFSGNKHETLFHKTELTLISKVTNSRASMLICNKITIPLSL